MTSEVNVVITPQEVAVAVSPQTITIEIADPAKIGPQGATGKSNYEIAVDNGFIGTESEWLLTITGPQVEVGPQGIQGIQGIQGLKGDTGPQGPKGDTGDAGVQGIQGVQGLKGDTGATGPQGTNGTDGDDGLSAYQVAVDNGFVGDEEDWLLSLVGETGATGPQGPQGVQGVAGATGPQGPAGANGTNGNDGADGDNGLSAYEVAVANGFVGTESQWLLSLVGPQGETGPAGTNGTNGLNGSDGADGTDGLSAYEVAVANGFVGNEAAWLASLVGATGATGPQGPTGATGANGNDGAAATIAVGTVTTGAAGSSAIITNVGTSSAAVFDFTIPRGDTGASGSGGTVTISSKTGAYTVVDSDLGSVINCTANTFTVSLTAATTIGAGFQCWVWNTSNTASHVITIDPNSTETIDGATTLILRRGEGVQIVCDGTNWQTAGTKKQRLYSENATNNVTRAAVTGSNAVGIGNAAVVSATSAVGIGDGATATGTSSVVIGTGRATTQDSVAIAITDNTTTYGAKTANNAMAIGHLHTCSASYGVAIGGSGNTVSGTASVVAGGSSCSAQSQYSAVVGGINGTTGGGAAAGVVLGGYGVTSNIPGKVAHGCYSNISGGVVQAGHTTLFAVTTTNTATVLCANTSAASASNQLVLSNNQSMSFRGQCVARRKGSELITSTAAWEFAGVIRREANAASTVLVSAVTPTLLAADVDASAWTVAISADTTNGALAVTVTGENSKSIRWVCYIQSTEVIYA